MAAVSAWNCSGGMGSWAHCCRIAEAAGPGRPCSWALMRQGRARAPVACEQVVRADCVEVFGVEEEAVHVEDACANGGEAERLSVR